MSNVSEELSQMGADLLLKAMNSLGQLSIEAARLVYEIGKDGIATGKKAGAPALVDLLNHLENTYGSEYDAKTQRAIKKMRVACEKKGATPLKATIETKDLPEIEKWLKKQDLLFVACTPKNKKPSEIDKLRNPSQLEDEDEQRLTTIYFMAEDKDKVSDAMAIRLYKDGLVNPLPPSAFFLLHDERNDISVVDGLDFNELRVFGELAQKYGVGYTEMKNGPEQAGESTPGTYKVVCEKANADKLKAIMRIVSWTMTGEDAPKIKEKVQERDCLLSELEKLITDGVRVGTKTFTDLSGTRVNVENAKYIVHTKAPHQFIKVTAKGFYRYKGGPDAEFVSKSDLDYEDQLRQAISEYSDAVIFDAEEWEKLGLDKMNLRKEHVLDKLTVLPLNHSLEKDEKELRKAQRKRMEKPEPLAETAWLYHNFDPENPESLLEVVEENYNDYSKPLGETVSVHYDKAVSRSEHYRYIDVESDEKTVDSIIMAAREKSAGNVEYEKEQEQVR